MASVEHLPAWEVAKTVVIFGDDRYHLIVVPADRYVNLSEVKCALDLKHIRLASEAEMATFFRIAKSAVPPSGSTICPYTSIANSLPRP